MIFYGNQRQPRTSPGSSPRSLVHDDKQGIGGGVGTGGGGDNEIGGRGEGGGGSGKKRNSGGLKGDDDDDDDDDGIDAAALEEELAAELVSLIPSFHSVKFYFYFHSFSCSILLHYIFFPIVFYTVESYLLSSRLSPFFFSFLPFFVSFTFHTRPS